MRLKTKFNHGANIFINVDPNNAIMETVESNNQANKFLDTKSVDSDGDGLTDDEKNDMRFDAYDPTAKKVISFKGSVDPDIKVWLEHEKGAIVEVIP